MEVVFSRRAFDSLCLEVKDKKNVETGGFFLGEFKNGVCYVFENIFPGPNAIHQKIYYEYDEQYVNYEINKLRKLYYENIDIVGVWHRHMSSKNYFSEMDHDMNDKLVKAFNKDIISAIVNVNKGLGITIYYTEQNYSDMQIKYSVEETLSINN